MTLKIGSALTGGVGRIANRNGAVLVLAYALVGLVWQVLFFSAFVTWLERSGVDTTGADLPTVEGPFAVLAVGAVVSLLGLQYLTIVAIRTFVGGYSRSIPSEYFTRNVVSVLVNSVVGGFVFGVIVTIGSVLVVPGIVAYVAFAFMMLFVAAEDENFVAALRDSWHLTRGHWLRLFALLAVLLAGITVVAGLLSVVLLIGVVASGNPALGNLLSGIVYLPFSLLTLAVLAEAFTQLRTDESTATDGSTAA